MIKPVLLTLLCSSLFGCGIVLFPVSIASSLEKNRTLHVHATITDENGNRLPRARAQLVSEVVVPNLHVVGMEAVELTWPTDFQSHVEVPNGNLDITRTGACLWVHISADGYYARTIEVTKDGTVERLPDDSRADNLDSGNYSVTPAAPLTLQSLSAFALERIVNPQQLRHYSYLRPSESPSGRLGYIDLDSPTAGYYPPPSLEPSHEPLPKNALYITAPRDPDGKMARQPGSDAFRPLRSLTLHCTSKDGGFIRIPLKDGRFLGGHLRQAPASGYQSKLILSPEDLAASYPETSLRIFFYFHHDHHYGYGVINHLWDFAVDTPPAGIEANVILSFDLFLQPDGSTNIE